jgi:DNA-binding NtrC family response regulator
MTNYAGKKISVLYLDDERACLNLFSETFADECEVRTATTYAEALRALAEERFDVVISDECMPDVQGSDFLREVALVSSESCRVLLSGAVTVGQVLPSLGSGAVEFFLPKPWNISLFRQVFERVGV